MIATDVASPFLAPFKLTMVVALFLAMPVILAQVWGFIAPGLYKHEKRVALPLLVSSIILFYAGMAFAYFLVFPMIFHFFASVTPEGVAMMTDINSYLDFVLTLFFAFGVAFEIPVATVLLIWIGVVDVEYLKKIRPYVIIGCFVVGMVLTRRTSSPRPCSRCRCGCCSRSACCSAAWYASAASIRTTNRPATATSLRPPASEPAAPRRRRLRVGGSCGPARSPPQAPARSAPRRERRHPAGRPPRRLDGRRSPAEARRQRGDPGSALRPAAAGQAADHPAAGLAATEDAPPGVADHRRDGRTEAGAAEQLPRGKSFWQTPFLDPAAIRENLVLGLEQARDTVLPEIIVEKRFKPFVEDRLPALAAGSLGLVGHPGPWPACPRAVEKPVTLAIGPEGGWIPYEVDKLREAGLHPVQLGERILRVETAVSACLRGCSEKLR